MRVDELLHGHARKLGRKLRIVIANAAEATRGVEGCLARERVEGVPVHERSPDFLSLGAGENLPCRKIFSGRQIRSGWQAYRDETTRRRPGCHGALEGE
jgi:hypothetical protein